MRVVLVEIDFEGTRERSCSDVIERCSSCLGRRFNTVAPKCAWPGVRARTSISEAFSECRSDRDLQTICGVTRDHRRHRELTHDALRDHVSLDGGQLEDGADVVPLSRRDFARRRHVGLVAKFAKEFHRGLHRYRRCDGQTQRASAEARRSASDETVKTQKDRGHCHSGSGCRLARLVWRPHQDTAAREEHVSVIDWLLDSDPAIRWQAMRDLTDAPAEAVAAERARVATEGWSARLLALRRKDGLWDTGTPGTEWITLVALLQLRDMGLDPSSGQARNAIALVRDNATWHNPRAPWNGKPVFAGEVEPCINGRIVALGAYFGIDVTSIVARLLGEQMADGGWNCEQENGSTRGSFHTTIDVIEGLLEHERATGGSAEVAAARARGQEYLLERRMLRRLSTGELIDPAFTKFSFPTGWHYDALRGLDHLRAAGMTPDARVAEAIDLVRSKRDAEGRLPLENPHDSEMVDARLRDLEFGMDEREGRPSRWNTLRALRVLRWAGSQAPPSGIGSSTTTVVPDGRRVA